MSVCIGVALIILYVSGVWPYYQIFGSAEYQNIQFCEYSVWLNIEIFRQSQILKIKPFKTYIF